MWHKSLCGLCFIALEFAGILAAYCMLKETPQHHECLIPLIVLLLTVPHNARLDQHVTVLCVDVPELEAGPALLACAVL